MLKLGGGGGNDQKETKYNDIVVRNEKKSITPKHGIHDKIFYDYYPSLVI
jgi:hypothetical protein